MYIYSYFTQQTFGFDIKGPDSQNLKQIQFCSCSKEDLSLQFFSTVLHLRGADVVPQPRCDPDTGNILCWNGEIFGGINVNITKLNLCYAYSYF